MESTSDTSILRVFVAGYSDLTDDEFENHYRKKLDDSIVRGAHFLLSDDPGTCDMVIRYLQSHHVAADGITVYRSTADGDVGGQHSSLFSNYKAVEVEGGETERYQAMAEAMRKGRCRHKRIIWLRPSDRLSKKLSGGDVLDMRFSGPKEAERSISARDVMDCMDLYDELA